MKKITPILASLFFVIVFSGCLNPAEMSAFKESLGLNTNPPVKLTIDDATQALMAKADMTIGLSKVASTCSIPPHESE